MILTRMYSPSYKYWGKEAGYFVTLEDALKEL